MVTITKEDLEALTSMVEKYRLRGVAEALAHICSVKAEVLREEWRDEVAASSWDIDGRRLDILSAKTDN